MSRMNRREFVQASSSSLLLGGMKALASRGYLADALTTFVRTNDEGKSWTVGNALWSGKFASTRSWGCTPGAGGTR